MAFLPGWTKRKGFDVNHLLVGAGGVSDFSMLMPMTMPDDVIAGLAYTDGRDIRFCSDDALTTYSHELVAIDTVAKTLQVWVRVPSLSSVADTTVWMNFGNPAAAMPSAAEQRATWADAGRWHLEETSGTFYDATANGNNGSDNVSATGKLGIIGGGQEFNYTSDYIGISGPVLGTIGPTSVFTLSAWVRPHTYQADWADRRSAVGAAVNKNDFEALIGLRYTSGGLKNKLSLEIGKAYVDSQSLVASATYTIDQWYYLVGVFNNGSAELFINGVSQGTVTYSATTNGATAHANGFGIGCEPDFFANNFPYRWNGNLDEARARIGAPSVPWVITEYNNQSAPDTFGTWGAVESAGGGGPHIIGHHLGRVGPSLAGVRY